MRRVYCMTRSVTSTLTHRSSTMIATPRSIYAMNGTRGLASTPSSATPTPVVSTTGVVTTKLISNRSTILTEIDRALGRTKPPAVEYIYVEPSIAFSLKWLFSFNFTSSVNPYGHAAIRYTLTHPPAKEGDEPRYEQIVMNIVGKSGAKMCNFMTPEEYLFGDPANSSRVGSEQGGVYHRAFRSFRIEDWPAERVAAMHAVYQQIASGQLCHTKGFSIILGPLFNYCRSATEQGNCAYWTTRGMVAAHLFHKWSAWPKWIFIKLYARFVRATLAQRYLSSPTTSGVHLDDRYASLLSSSVRPKLPSLPGDPYGLDKYFVGSNINMVSYSCHSASAQPMGWITPIHFLSSDARSFRQLESLASVIVDYEDRPSRQVTSPPIIPVVPTPPAADTTAAANTSSATTSTSTTVLSDNVHGRVAVIRKQVGARPYLPDTLSSLSDNKVGQFIRRWWQKVI